MAPASIGFMPLEPVDEGRCRIAEPERDGVTVFLPDADDGAGVRIDAGRVGQDQNVRRTAIVQANHVGGFIRRPIKLPKPNLDEPLAECPARFDRLMQHDTAHQAAQFPATGEAPEERIPSHLLCATIAARGTDPKPAEPSWHLTWSH